MNSWWLWLIVGMVLGGGPVWLLVSWLLDRAYADGWDQAADRIKLRQVKRLLAGHVLMIDEHGPYWHDPRPQLEPAERPGNGSHLPSDRQVRAELAAIADEAPAATSPAAGQDVPRAERDSSPHDGDGLREAFDSPAVSGIGPVHSESRPPLPPGGAGPEPPGPAERQLRGDAPIRPVPDSPAGPGDLFALLPDEEAFAVIRWEFARLTRMVAEPYKLTGWSAA